MSEKIHNLPDQIQDQRQIEKEKILGIKEPGRLNNFAKNVLSFVGIETKKDEIPNFDGGIDILKSPEECTSAQEALGVFWANELISGVEDISTTSGSEGNRYLKSKVLEKVGGFAKAVEYLAQKRREEIDKSNHLEAVIYKVEFSPLGDLVDALKLAGLATNDSGEPYNRIVLGNIFHCKTYSREEDGLVTVNAIQGDQLYDKNSKVCDIQIWPKV